MTAPRLIRAHRRLWLALWTVVAAAAPVLGRVVMCLFMRFLRKKSSIRLALVASIGACVQRVRVA